jgi:hypothetical protein
MRAGLSVTGTVAFLSESCKEKKRRKKRDREGGRDVWLIIDAKEAGGMMSLNTSSTPGICCQGFCGVATQARTAGVSRIECLEPLRYL